VAQTRPLANLDREIRLCEGIFLENIRKVAPNLRILPL